LKGEKVGKICLELTLESPGARKMEIDEEIGLLRCKIDALDEEILCLLNQRAKHIMETGRVKLKRSLETYDPQREEEIIDRLKWKNSVFFHRRPLVMSFAKSYRPAVSW
jgi:chorismate mutase